MGCFLGCFGRRKNRRRQRRRESFQPRLNRNSDGSTKDNQLKLRVSTVEEVPKVSEVSANDDLFRVPTVKEVPKVSEGSAKIDHLNFRVPSVEEVPKVSVIPITDICDKVEEKYSPSPTRKRVTFDTNVKTYEHIDLDESIELFKEEEKSRCPSEGSDITSNSSGSYPSNHRYQNCRESDDEDEDITDCDESDLDDEDGGLMIHEDYFNDDDDSYESKLKNWDKEVYTEEIADNVLEIEEKTASARDRTGYVNSVLNPIENLTQWKAVKSKGRTTTTTTQTQQTRKENANLVSDREHKRNASFNSEPRVVDELPTFSLKPKPRDETRKHKTQEVAVDASLSTWLSTSTSVSMSETATSAKNKSYSKPVQSHDERPVLCALTAEEVKQFSATNSPRKSSSRSPESPIIGTVGRYWNSQSMATSKYREV